MKAKTKAVGGTPTTQLGQDWNSFLGGGLNSGTFGSNAVNQTQGFGGAINSLLGGQIGDPSSLQGFLQGLQGNGGLGNIPNVSGNFNAPQFQGLDFSQLGQVGGQNPQFNAANIQQGQGQAGLNLGGLNLGQFQGANLNQNVGGAQNLPGINFNPAQFQGADLMGGAGSANLQNVQFNPSRFQNIGFQQGLGGAAGLDPNGSFSQALQQIQQNQLNQGVADVRERFTGQSGTPAGFAEAALRAQMAPQLTAALSQANQAERGLNLQQLGMNQDTVNQMNQLRLQQSLAGNSQGLQNQQLGLQAQGLQSQNQLQNQQLLNQAIQQQNQQRVDLAGQANQVGMQNAQLGLNAQGINTGNLLQNAALNQQGNLGLNNQLLQQSQNQNQFGLQGAGLQQGQQLGLNSQLLQQLGLSNEAINALNQANLGQAQGQNQFNIQNAGLQQQGQQSNVQNQLAQMAQMLQQNQFGNQFGAQNAQFGANLGQQAQGQNAQNALQNQGMMNQFGLGQAGIGMQNQQTQLQGILGVLSQLFGSQNQQAGLATPQAQIVQQPSAFSQITGALGNLGGAISPFMSMGLGGLGSLFGGGVPSLNPQQLQGMIGTTPQQMPKFQMPLVR